MSLHLPFAADSADPVQALRHLDVESVLLPILLQLSLIILAARVFAVLFRRLAQQSVAGDIAAAIVLGPSVFGRLFTGAFEAYFHPPDHGHPPELDSSLLDCILTTLSQQDLIFLLSP